MLTAKDFQIPSLGAAKLASPLTEAAFIADTERVMYHTDLTEVLREAAHPEELLSFEKMEMELQKLRFSVSFRILINHTTS